MLKFKNLSICLLLLFALGCSQDAVEPQQNIQTEKLSTIKVTDNSELSSLLDDLQSYKANHRTALTGLNLDSLNKAIQLKSDSQAGSVYSILIKSNNPRKFVNLVFNRTESATYSYLLEFTSANIIYSNSMRDFTGTMQVINLEGELMDSYQVKKGIFSRKIANSNRSMEQCTRVEYVDYQDNNGNPCNPEESSTTSYDFPSALTKPCYEVVKVEFNCPPSIVPSSGSGGGGGESTSSGSTPTIGGGSGSSSSSGNTGSEGGTSEASDNDFIDETPILIDFETFELGELLEEQIDDTELDPCIQEILAELKSINAGVGQQIAALDFGGEDTYFNWSLQSGSTSEGGTAETNTGNNNTVINNDAYPNASDLSWARTILHEAVHAYLIAWFKSNQIETKAEKYPFLWEDMQENMGLNKAQHNEMIRTFVLDIGISLQEYGLKKGYDIPSQYYMDLAWGGLTSYKNSAGAEIEFDWFKAIIDSPEDRDRINNVIQIELTGKDRNDNVQIQRGTDPGC